MSQPHNSHTSSFKLLAIRLNILQPSAFIAIPQRINANTPLSAPLSPCLRHCYCWYVTLIACGRHLLKHIRKGRKEAPTLAAGASFMNLKLYKKLNPRYSGI